MNPLLLSAFLRRLGYTFTDETLRDTALTHRSASSRHNERLEFLGDALLGHVITSQIYQRFPDASEGELSRMRASLVKEKTLAELATELQLGDVLHLGSGELKSGGFRRESILADALEALIGAIYLDGGFPVCEQVVLRLFADRLEQLPDAGTDKDAKTQLQEALQGARLPLPLYELLGTYGDAHAQTFHVRCTLHDGSQSEGRGSSRRRAEQQAASVLLKQMQRA
ncbi:ribonuclease III [Permianibacter sp. IMCC34836]|uniref:ribonuclease III n=1 Tax=Permianibacter fluminis TaxID=2738515 RepID=UPI00155683AF|nr:ribonuclease III [Permianibacter fluminis]NQD37359.1 ribonuclease III [Permianibacter fluminis]